MLHIGRIAAVTGVLIACGTGAASGYSVVVSPTPYSSTSVALSVAATALLDADSVFMCYREYPGPVKYQVVNLISGAVELSPQIAPGEGVSPTCAVVSSDTAIIASRNDVTNEGSLLVVNPLTGALKRGPIVFTHSGNSLEYRLTVADTSTVFVAWRSDDMAEGRFAIVNPLTGTVSVPETAFEPLGINTVDVVALDPYRVAVAYQRSISGPIAPTRSFVSIRDAHSGASLRDAIELEANFGVPRIVRVNANDVIVAYRTAAHSRFVVVNTLTGTTNAPVTYTDGLTSDFSVSPVLLGDDAVFVPYWRPDDGPLPRPTPGNFVVTDLNGVPLVHETTFTPLSTDEFSAVASGCRVFVAYRAGDEQVGTFQFLDFSGVCRPPCPTDMTTGVNVLRSGFSSFLSPSLQIQLVLVQNTTQDAIPGPIAFVPTNLQNGFLFSTESTSCAPPIVAPFVEIHPGPDEVLSPGEVAGRFLFFLRASPDPITYTPRVLGGIPQR